MRIGTSLLLLAVGAILAFAVDASVSGLDISTVGIILMVVGAVGLVLSFVLADRLAGSRGVVAEREVVAGQPVERRVVREREVL